MSSRSLSAAPLLAAVVGFSLTLHAVGASPFTSHLPSSSSAMKCAAVLSIPHVFTTKPEVLVEGKIARLGGSVRLLGVGFPQCLPVSLAVGPPNADFQRFKSGVNTDRFGAFKVRVSLPKPPAVPATTKNFFVYPIVGQVLGPTALVGVLPKCESSGTC